jgi:hypothetical protein
MSASAWIQRAFWEITDDCWKAIECRLAPGMRTLETGSGRSTGLFEAAGCAHTALEHDRKRRAPYPSVILTRLSGSPPWYNWEPGQPFDLIFIDGPPGRIGRSGILRVLPRLLHRGTFIVLDDTQRRAERRLAGEIATRYQMNLDVHTTRTFGISRGFSILSPSSRASSSTQPTVE